MPPKSNQALIASNNPKIPSYQLPIPDSLAGTKFTLFSFLETLRRAGEGVEIEAESGRFLLALSDLPELVLS